MSEKSRMDQLIFLKIIKTVEESKILIKLIEYLMF